MKAIRTVALVIGVVFALSGLASRAQAQQFPRALAGKIVTNAKPLQIPSAAKSFLKKMKRQDRSKFKRDADGKWTIHFVAFFKRPLPVEDMGVVVLDTKKEPVAVADVKGQKGQRTLASQITVDSTESPGKKHTLQVYYAKGNKPIILAKKIVILK